jgi:hypothetical protein
MPRLPVEATVYLCLCYLKIAFFEPCQNLFSLAILALCFRLFVHDNRFVR